MFIRRVKRVEFLTKTIKEIQSQCGYFKILKSEKNEKLIVS